MTGSNRLRLQTSLGNALIWAKGHQAPETSAAFARARELASQVEDASERFSAYWGLFAGHFNRCEPAPMREMAELFLREATAEPDCPEAVVAHRNFGTTCFYFGDYAGAHDHFQKTIKLYDQAHHADFANRFGQDPRAAAQAYDALALWVLGRVDEALPLAERALAGAGSAAHAPTMASVLQYAALLGLFGATPKQSRPAAERWPILRLDTISRRSWPASRGFFRAGQGPMVPKGRGSPRCEAASPSFGSQVTLCACPVSKRPWPKPKRVPARLMPGSGAWTVRCARRAGAHRGALV